MFTEATLKRIKSVLKKKSHNNKLENVRKIVKYQYRSVVADHNTATFLKNWNNSSLSSRMEKSHLLH
jgi:hypothetical protein